MKIVACISWGCLAGCLFPGNYFEAVCLSWVGLYVIEQLAKLTGKE